VQRTRKDRVAQLDLLDDDRVHVVLELHAPGLGVGGAGGSAMQVLELALRQVNRQVSEPLLELRAPLVRPLQVVEPAPRLVPLNQLLELRLQLASLTARRCALKLLAGLLLEQCCEHSCLDTVGGPCPCPPLPAVSARAVSGARPVWCVSSCRTAFAFLFFSVASPLLSARCARAGCSAPCARCSGTVPAAPRAARCASGSSSCCTAHWASPHARRTTATAFHKQIGFG